MKKNIRINRLSYKFFISEKTFKPTATTEFLLKDSLKIAKNKYSILDLGCGIGIIAILIAKKLKLKKTIFASDISDEAIKITKKNFALHKFKVDARVGSLLEPWKNEKFDLIINDVSGISAKIAEKSDWFRNVSCKTGNDGTNLTLKVLKDAKKFINDKGYLILPVISLSNTKKIFQYAKKSFKKLNVLSKNLWFLPDNINIKKSTLEKMRKKNLIDFEFKFGKVLCYTTIILLQKN